MRILGLIALLLSLAGAKAPDTACAIDAGTLSITGLPTRDTFSVTADFYPVGTTLRSPDGTWTVDWPYPSAYVWQRGGGPSLAKPGAQLNDYHLIATCAA